MSDAAFNVFGAVAGALGIIGLLPLVYILVRNQLPIYKLKALEALLAETKDLLFLVVEEGHLLDGSFVYEVELELDGFQKCADELKLEAYRAEGYMAQLRGMVSGLSYRIYTVYRKVKKTRTKISCKAFDEKKKRTTETQDTSPAVLVTSTGDDPVDEKLDDDPDLSREDKDPSQGSLETLHNTRDPPAYCANVSCKTFNQYTEASRTEDEDAVVPAVATERQAA